MNSLSVIGRRWFQKTYGNTYHSATVEIDGQAPETVVDFAYGYDDHYMTTAQEALVAAGRLPEPAKNESLWRQCERLGIDLEYYAIDVKRRRDL